MTGDKNSLTPHDAELGFVLKRHDPVAPPDALELAALEKSIWARIDALPGRDMPDDIEFPFWVSTLSWALRGAAMAAVLVAMLGFGFTAGRNLNETTAVATDQEMLFASAGSMPWQSFLTEPQSSGDTDDSSE